MEKVIKFVTFEEAKENDMLFLSKLTPEELLKETFDLRKLNYFGNIKGELPRLKKVLKFLNKDNYEKENA